MPAESQDNLKGTSPSKNIQRGNDQAWDAQNKQSSTTAQEALKKKWTNSPIPVSGNKS